MAPPATAAARPLVTVQSVEGDMAIDGAGRKMALLSQEERVKAKAEKVEKRRKQPKEEHEAEDMQHGPLPVEQLQASGIVVGDVQKIKDRLCTVEDVIYSPGNELLQMKGISKAKVDKIIEKASKLVLGPSQMHAQRKIIQITSGSREIDKILEGGIETGSITEIYGEPGLGKTQLCYTLCVTCQLPLDRGGVDGKAMYIDTQGTFRAKRLLEIAERFGLNGAEVLENVSYARAYNVYHQSMLLQEVASMMVKTRFALMIVDSVTALYKIDFSEREVLAAEMCLAEFLRSLQKLAEEFGVAVVITNEVMDEYEYVGRRIKPMFGNIFAHASTTRLALFNGSGNERICKVASSASSLCLAEAEAPFQISSGGVTDVKD